MPLPGSLWFDEAQKEGRLQKELAEKMRRGKGFGSHTYLFKQENYSDRSWHGIAMLLAYLPYMPSCLVRFLLSTKVYRYFGFSSFLCMVGISRFLYILRGKDRVGESHVQRIRNRLISSIIFRKKI